MVLKGIVVVLLVVMVGSALVVIYGAFRWQESGRRLEQRLDAARVPIEARSVDFAELESLPAPVQHYLRAALTAGRPIVAAARIEHTGTFNMGEAGERWKPFHSTQRVVTRRPGFVWDGRVAVFPGVAVRVHDGYVAGDGILRATLFGLVPLVDMPRTPELARGELMRYLAEAVWYPTALLPSQGIDWAAVDDRSAAATLRDGATSATLLFRFGEDGLIASVRAEDRGYAMQGRVVPMPWQGRFWGYTEQDGMRVPREGEVAWLLPEGPRPYWRGRIDQLGYEFAP